VSEDDEKRGRGQKMTTAHAEIDGEEEETEIMAV
jgi:hypothetical protein